MAYGQRGTALPPRPTVARIVVSTTYTTLDGRRCKRGDTIRVGLLEAEKNPSDLAVPGGRGGGSAS